MFTRGRVCSPNSPAPPPAAVSAVKDFDSVALPENFCIIESPESVKDFATLQVGVTESEGEGRGEGALQGLRLRASGGGGSGHWAGRAQVQESSAGRFQDGQGNMCRSEQVGPAVCLSAQPSHPSPSCVHEGGMCAILL